MDIKWWIYLQWY